MKSKTDEQILKLRAKRARAHMRLEILRKGIAAVLADEYHEASDLYPVLEVVNGEFISALELAREADKAMEPYWRRSRLRRRRVIVTPPITKVKPKN